MQKQNRWFVPGVGIAREVLEADLQRYLGPEALLESEVGTGGYAVRLAEYMSSANTDFATLRVVTAFRSSHTEPSHR
jgi:hypothetical protein